MKAHSFLLLALTGLLVVPVQAQLTTPANPNQVTKRNLGENGGASTGTATVGVRPVPAPEPIVVQYVAVSPLRAWTNGEGKQMSARLLAFSAPKEGETGAVEVIRGGKVRFLLAGGKAPIDYPLENLNRADQLEIKAIAQAALGGPPGNKSEDESAEEGAKAGDREGRDDSQR